MRTWLYKETIWIPRRNDKFPMIFGLMIWPRRTDSFVLQTLPTAVFHAISKHYQCIYSTLNTILLSLISAVSSDILSSSTSVSDFDSFSSFVSLISLHMNSHCDQMANFSWDLAFCFLIVIVGIYEHLIHFQFQQQGVQRSIVPQDINILFVTVSL